MSDEPGIEPPVSDAPPVTSTVNVAGKVTERIYSDGTMQRNVWEGDAQAQEYADSVAAQEGAN